MVQSLKWKEFFFFILNQENQWEEGNSGSWACAEGVLELTQAQQLTGATFLSSPG